MPVSQGGGAPQRPTKFLGPPTYTHSVGEKNNQILHGDQTRCEVNFYVVDHECLIIIITRICAAEMAVRYTALSACRKVHVCHCNSLGGAT